MSATLRILLVVVSVLVVAFVLHKIRKSHLAIDDSVYWIFFSVFLMLLAVFPGVAIWCSDLIGIQSASNFVFLVMIFFVLVKLFYVSIDLSVNKHRLNHLVQKLALLECEQRENSGEKGGKDLNKTE